jgi:hypothetical protein
MRKREKERERHTHTHTQTHTDTQPSKGAECVGAGGFHRQCCLGHNFFGTQVPIYKGRFHLSGAEIWKFRLTMLVWNFLGLLLKNLGLKNGLGVFVLCKHRKLRP